MVEFESAEQAAEAINTLHLSEVRSGCMTPRFATSQIPLSLLAKLLSMKRPLDGSLSVQVDGREIYVRYAHRPTTSPTAVI